MENDEDNACDIQTSAIIDEVYPQFKKFGDFLRERGFNSASSGNISVRRGNKMYITRRGSMKGDLHPGDIVETCLDHDDSSIVISSTETYIHRNILLRTPGLATIHCHPPYTVALSIYYTEVLNQDNIVPIDVEGYYLLKKIPIITLKNPTGSKEMEEAIPKALMNFNIMILRGHGVFSRGPNLTEAYNWVTIVEEASSIIFKCLQLGMDIKKMQGQFDQW
ncbi:MAG TPA: class II aldolase/adducin family protein [Candidatus Lokiarchaeia archaeon]|nr:class II aldolase/adducin family protein [Candidatus Lokiarchaeia archaeon]